MFDPISSRVFLSMVKNTAGHGKVIFIHFFVQKYKSHGKMYDNYVSMTGCILGLNLEKFQSSKVLTEIARNNDFERMIDGGRSYFLKTRQKTLSFDVQHYAVVV